MERAFNVVYRKGAVPAYLKLAGLNQQVLLLSLLDAHCKCTELQIYPNQEGPGKNMKEISDGLNSFLEN